MQVARMHRRAERSHVVIDDAVCAFRSVVLADERLKGERERDEGRGDRGSSCDAR